MSTCAKLYDKIILKLLQVTLDKCKRLSDLIKTGFDSTTRRHLLEMCDVHQDKNESRYTFTLVQHFTASTGKRLKASCSMASSSSRLEDLYPQDWNEKKHGP